MGLTDLFAVVHLCAAAPEQEQSSSQSPSTARSSAPGFSLRKQQHDLALVFVFHKTRNYSLVQSPGTQRPPKCHHRRRYRGKDRSIPPQRNRHDRPRSLRARRGLERQTHIRRCSSPCQSRKLGCQSAAATTTSATGAGTAPGRTVAHSKAHALWKDIPQQAHAFCPAYNSLSDRTRGDDAQKTALQKQAFCFALTKHSCFLITHSGVDSGYRSSTTRSTVAQSKPP